MIVHTPIKLFWGTGRSRYYSTKHTGSWKCI